MPDPRVTAPPVHRREELARAWRRSATTSSYIPRPAAELEELLLELVDTLLDTLAATEFSMSAGSRIGARLVREGFVDPAALASTIEVLTDGLLGDMEQTPDTELSRRTIALLGALSAGYAEGLRSYTLTQQEQVKQAMFNSVLRAESNLREIENRFQRGVRLLGDRHRDHRPRRHVRRGEPGARRDPRHRGAQAARPVAERHLHRRGRRQRDGRAAPDPRRRPAARRRAPQAAQGQRRDRVGAPRALAVARRRRQPGLLRHDGAGRHRAAAAAGPARPPAAERRADRPREPAVFPHQAGERVRARRAGFDDHVVLSEPRRLRGAQQQPRALGRRPRPPGRRRAGSRRRSSTRTLWWHGSAATSSPC